MVKANIHLSVDEHTSRQMYITNFYNRIIRPNKGRETNKYLLLFLQSYYENNSVEYAKRHGNVGN